MEKSKLTIILLFLILTINLAHPQSKIEYGFSYIINTSEENKNLKEGIEKTLDKIYKTINEHIVNNNDKDFIKRIYIHQNIANKELEISTLREDMDKKTLQNTISSREKNKTEIKINEIKKDIENIKIKQKELEEYLTNLKKIKAKYKKNEAKINLANLSTEFLISQELFFINYVHIKKVDKHYLVEINNITPKEIQVKKEIFKLSSSSDDIANKIANLSFKEILGREFIKIKINVINNLDAKIYINEQFVSKGIYNNDIWDISDLPKKEISINITSITYKPYAVKQKIKSGDTINLTINLQKENSRRISIKSNVTSKVFKKGIFIGETPIKIEEPEGIESILLQAKGYKNMFKMISKEDKEINIEMLKTNKSELTIKRDLFYINLGIFTLSLIGTAFAITKSNEASELYNIALNKAIKHKITPKDLYNAKSEQMITTFLLGTGITLSVGSFIPLIIHLVKYIQEASRGE
ncbi:hypothetical protein [Borrelia miyamotoi]|uniref:PEGA domain-containing protein n=1 Tax=Borrelia miyamotoi TaxID=47466 RepID=A0AAQ2WXK3_9SPIR|nr:hypothetical protein [Borrelia miyamotoi]AGT27079.1 hypothetical protein I871_00385 [Borrelia miyamotoi LB-2001]AJA58287.1 hypothetical protein RJ61_00360 [Borrelia miyamotoi]AOW95364.1 hypothetical protein AXH25_00370 [Borrelia miyamotoi]QTL83241.1 hypothetical protein bmLB2001_000073 [Borrelia miyamotoi]WAZ85474.1 hypothetical protein O5400_03950 [Borrelia miyamotoi]